VILVDTSVWIDHLHRRDEVLAALLGEGKVLSHPFVIRRTRIGQLAPARLDFGLAAPSASASMARDSEVRLLIGSSPCSGWE